jgi:hypothetical protein
VIVIAGGGGGGGGGGRQVLNHHKEEIISCRFLLPKHSKARNGLAWQPDVGPARKDMGLLL